MLAFVLTFAACCGSTKAASPPKPASCAGPSGATRVFYVTDRAAVDSKQLFSGERGLARDRAPIVSYGTIGEPASPKTTARCASRAAFFGALDTRSSGAPRRMLVYVHGYYTTFETAMKDALVIERGLRFAGPTIAFSWPSRATSRLAYVTDENNASWAIGDFRALLDGLLAKYPTAEITFATHSLGSRFAAEGIAFVRRACTKCVGPAVFFAPDIDSDTLRAELRAAGRCADKPPQHPAAAAPVTIYVSNKDLALRQSQRLHGHQRAGQAASEMIVCRGVDTIDLGYYKSSDPAAHSYHVEPRIVEDARAALARISPAAASRRLTPVARGDARYYELRR